MQSKLDAVYILKSWVRFGADLEKGGNQVSRIGDPNTRSFWFIRLEVFLQVTPGQ